MEKQKKSRMIRKIITASIIMGIFAVGTFAAGNTAIQDDVLSVSVSAVDTQTTSDGFVYYIENGAAVITKYNDTTATSLTIPSKISGYSVSTIGEYAFQNMEKLSTVTIPSSVKTINRALSKNVHLFQR